MSAEGMESQESLFDPIPEMGGVPPSHNDSTHRVRNVHHTDKGFHKPQSRRSMSQRLAEGLPVSFSPGEGAAAATSPSDECSWDHEEDHGSKMEANDLTDNHETSAGESG